MSNEINMTVPKEELEPIEMSLEKEQQREISEDDGRYVSTGIGCPIFVSNHPNRC